VSTFDMSLRARALLLAASVAATFTGCTNIELAFGLRTRLDNIPIDSLSARITPGPRLAPGQSAHVIVVATTRDGRQLATAGAGQGDVLLDSYVFSSSLVSVDEDGLVTMPADPRITDGQTPHVQITLKSSPQLFADLDVPLRYDVAYRSDFSGGTGANGFDGNDGLDGMMGSDGSTDPDHLAPGGNGSDGSNGSDGGEGFPGAAGEAVHIWLTLAPTLESRATPRLQARVEGTTRKLFYLIDAAGGSLEITANGGAGGSGGRGGRGGRGGAGGIGWPAGSPGHDGLDGHSGFDGTPGASGTIAVSVDPKASSFITCLHLFNKDGSGRAGPAPIVHIEPVGPLW